jgi:ParB family chromosome partitioning protein
VLTADRDLLRQAAREMLTGVLSCRDNRSRSGLFARIASEAIGASLLLPNMATEDFLSCLSRGALETAARAEGVNIAPRVKDTRARMVTRFKDGTFVYPAALFALTPEEQAATGERRAVRSVTGWVNPVTSDDGEGDDGGVAAAESSDEEDAGSDNDLAEREAA